MKVAAAFPNQPNASSQGQVQYVQGLLKTVSSLSFLEMFVPFLEGPSSVPAPFPFSSHGKPQSSEGYRWDPRLQ